ncbi:MAG: 50S ribosomal protein L10 [Clostridia bacterium]|nr:50S ribosomal protein L10 [Clostridia bacterium]
MSKNRERKEREVEELAGRLGRARAAVLADFRGLTVAEDTELRKRLRQAGVEYRVVKNTLLRLAAAKAGLSDLEAYLAGPTSLALSAEDPVAPARVLAQFAREHPQLTLKAGVLEGRPIGAELVREVAELPPREVLFARVAAGLAAPLARLATVLRAPMQGLATALDALARARAQAEGAQGA